MTWNIVNQGCEKPVSRALFLEGYTSENISHLGNFPYATNPSINDHSLSHQRSAPHVETRDIGVHDRLLQFSLPPRPLIQQNPNLTVDTDVHLPTTSTAAPCLDTRLVSRQLDIPSVSTHLHQTSNSRLDRANRKRRIPTVAQRRAANVRERRRMFNLNEAFDLLRTVIPTFAYEKRLSRIETLRLAIAYIAFMRGILRGEEPSSLRVSTYGDWSSGDMSDSGGKSGDWSPASERTANQSDASVESCDLASWESSEVSLDPDTEEMNLFDQDLDISVSSTEDIDHSFV